MGQSNAADGTGRDSGAGQCGWWHWEGRLSHPPASAAPDCSDLGVQPRGERPRCRAERVGGFLAEERVRFTPLSPSCLSGGSQPRSPTGRICWAHQPGDTLNLSSGPSWDRATDPSAPKQLLVPTKPRCRDGGKGREEKRGCSAALGKSSVMRAGSSVTHSALIRQRSKSSFVKSSGARAARPRAPRSRGIRFPSTPWTLNE